MTPMTTITHHHLSVEQVNDDQGQAIMLTQQDGHSEPQTVLVHPWQLRAACEHLGLIETSDPQAARTIAKLKRQLLALNERVEHLAHWLANHSDHAHANLEYEQTYAVATADIAAEFCADLLDTTAPAPSKPDVSAAKASTLATTGKPAPATAQASLV